MSFGTYKNFNQCLIKNKDKTDPFAYCGAIKHKIEDRLIAEAYENEYKKVVKSTLEKWQQEGKTFAIIKNEDSEACEFCKKKNNTEINIVAALRNPNLVPPYHNNCRCYLITNDKKEQMTSFGVFKEALMPVYHIVEIKEEKKMFKFWNLSDYVEFGKWLDDNKIKYMHGGWYFIIENDSDFVKVKDYILKKYNTYYFGDKKLNKIRPFDNVDNTKPIAGFENIIKIREDKVLTLQQKDDDPQQFFKVYSMPDVTKKLFTILNKNRDRSTRVICNYLMGRLLSINDLYMLNGQLPKNYWVAGLTIPPKSTRDEYNFNFDRNYTYDTIDALYNGPDGFYEYRRRGESSHTLIFIKKGHNFYHINNEKLNNFYSALNKEEDLTTGNTVVSTPKLAGSSNKSTGYNIFKKVFKKEPEFAKDFAIIENINKFFEKKEGIIDEIKSVLKKYIKNPIILGLIIWYIARQLNN